jgi:two-component system KDP operon response regulator KdpE
LASQRNVLIVDRCEETREVLRTALERRGLRIFTTPRRRQGLELARQHHLDLIVLDLELDCGDGEDCAATLVQQSEKDCTPMVVLGTVRRRPPPLPGREFIAKPYHYGPLIRRIEALLSTTQQTLARGA